MAFQMMVLKGSGRVAINVSVSMLPLFLTCEDSTMVMPLEYLTNHMFFRTQEILNPFSQKINREFRRSYASCRMGGPSAVWFADMFDFIGINREMIVRIG